MVITGVVMAVTVSLVVKKRKMLIVVSHNRQTVCFCSANKLNSHYELEHNARADRDELLGIRHVCNDSTCMYAIVNDKVRVAERTTISTNARTTTLREDDKARIRLISVRMCECKLILVHVSSRAYHCVV